jgi:hypothetical protein
VSDFTNITEIAGVFAETEEDSGVDFVSVGDAGLIVIEGDGFGEGAFGSGPFGGAQVVILSSSTTWTDVETP